MSVAGDSEARFLKVTELLAQILSVHLGDMVHDVLSGHSESET